MIGDFLLQVINWIIATADFVARYGSIIPQKIIAALLHWLLWIIVMIGIAGVTGLVILQAGRKFFRFFKENQADEISVFVGLLDMAIVIFLADEMKAILSINLMWLFLITFMGYTAIRAIIQAEQK